MNREDLAAAKVVGFFSMPHVSLGERNPDAYNNALASLPAGAGSCDYCGTGILHHVVIQLASGQRKFIGMDCAEKVGNDKIRACVRNKQTAEQKAAADAKRDEQCAKWRAEQAEIEARHSARKEQFKDVLAALLAQQTSFHHSLAEQLINGDLSDRQAEYAAKAMFGRRNKRNADEFDSLIEKMAGCIPA